MAKPDREVPYCTIFLVVGAIVCHALVLTGNLATARAMEQLGHSTHGWANVGVGLADSMSTELNQLMHQTSSILTTSINHVQQFQTGLDTAMSFSGNLADGILTVLAPPNHTHGHGRGRGAALLATGSAVRAPSGRQLPIPAVAGVNASNVSAQVEGLIASVLQNVYRDVGINVSRADIMNPNNRLPLVPQDQLRPALRQQLTTSVGHVLNQVTPLLNQFLQLVRPALLQIGQWLVSFGDRIRATIETFSTTLDRVQSIINQLMSKLSHSAGAGEEQMIYDTFTLFDASNTGFITAQDLHDVARMYSLSSLQGQIADDLHQRYDANHDGRINREEYALLVHDEQIPGAMSMVLRTYARRLSEIAGTVGAARLRDEVASAVVDYFTLVCSKNMTKVGWVSQTLTNQSVPMEFSADILKQLAENEDNPNQLTTADVGAIVVNEMARLNGPYVGQVLALMSRPTFWVSEGFSLNDQPAYVERVVRWVTQASNSAEVLASVPALASAASGGSGNLTATLPALARNLTEASVASYRESQPVPNAGMYSSTCSLDLRDMLLGGIAASDGNNDPAQQQAANAGVPARPSTLLFAARLASNATATARTFQDQAMAYSGTSSDALDNFANQIQNMLQRVTSFLNNMQEYATPTGIQRIEQMVSDFASHAASDIAGTVVACADRGLSAQLPGHLLGSAPAPVAALSGVFNTLQNVMSSFQTILPGVVADLQFARRQVSSVSQTLNTTFLTFRSQGPPIFQTVSSLYSTIWTAYFVLFTVLTTSVLFYGFWASGWFGGPQAAVVEAYEPPQTFRDRCLVCCASCGACMRACHDSSLCFWSVALLMEVIVLLLFIVSIVLCLLSGIKAFLSAGCAQVYILNDDSICTGTLGTLRQWLATFLASDGIPLGSICDQQSLRTCHLIGRNLRTSAILTAIGSLVAAVLSFQMIIESAIMHERARWRRMFDEESKKV